MGGETNVPGILVGMTRDEVIGVLGSNFESYNGFDRPPFVDSFPYVEGGRTRYIHRNAPPAGCPFVVSGAVAPVLEDEVGIVEITDTDA